VESFRSGMPRDGLPISTSPSLGSGGAPEWSQGREPLVAAMDSILFQSPGGAADPVELWRGGEVGRWAIRKSRRPSGAFGRLGVFQSQGLAPLATFRGSSGARGRGALDRAFGYRPERPRAISCSQNLHGGILTTGRHLKDERQQASRGGLPG